MTAGGAVYNCGLLGISSDEITDENTIASKKFHGIQGSFVANNAVNDSYTDGGAIYNDGRIGIDNTQNIFTNETNTFNGIYGDFKSNSASNSLSERADENFAQGGAIFNYSSFSIRGRFETINNDFKAGYYLSSSNPVVPLNISDSYFENNTALSTGGEAKGGAIFVQDINLNITADNQQTLFSGNKTITNGAVESNAIHIRQNVDSIDADITDRKTLSLIALNDGVIRIDDKITGDGIFRDDSDPDKITETVLTGSKYAYNLDLAGNSSGKIIINNEIKNAHIKVENTNVYVPEAAYLAPNPSLNVNSGILEIDRLANETINYDSFSVNGIFNLKNVEADLKNKTMGRITADSYGASNGSINVQNITLLSDAKEDSTFILFADSEIAGTVAYTGPSPIAYSPLYKYNVSYNGDDGMFLFSRGSSSSNPSDNFNPTILAPPVVAQAGAYTTQLQTFNYAFQHIDTFMALPYLERVELKNRNRYALSPTADATDVGNFSPLFTKSEENGFWVKPYSSFENVPLKNGPKVQNINYGTLIGYDSKLTPIAHGADRVITGYIGYNGASQHFQGISASQNGGIIGGTIILYKGSFFNATTLGVGAVSGENSGMYGSENYTMLLSGIGNKTGYNFELLKSRIIIQPSLLMSYTFVNTFDYNNAAGVRIKSDPLNALQIAPGVKLIGNLSDGWQPYLAVNMIWNLLDRTKVTANDVRLPEMSIDPYVEYELGIQRRWSERFTAYGQAMLRNGGRNGISLTAGFRWSLGKNKS